MHVQETPFMDECSKKPSLKSRLSSQLSGEGGSRRRSLKKRLSVKLSNDNKYERFDHSPRGSKKQRKAKVGITPPQSPTSPVSLNSFGSEKSQNGYYNKAFAASPKHVRTMSDTSDAGIDGHFKFLEGYSSPYPEVFTISAGNGTASNTDTLSKRSEKSEGHGSPIAGGTGTSPEDKYKWNDTDSVGDAKHRKTKSRKVCVVLLVTILVIGLLAGVAVILAFKVFGVGESDDQTTTTIRPEILILDGSLDLDETWDPALDNRSSALYIQTANNFTAEIDKLMLYGEYNESYMSCEVLKFSPGSIKSTFRMHFNDRYKLKAETESAFARLLQTDIRRRAGTSPLNIKQGTVFINDIVKLTSSTLSSTTVSASTTSKTTTPVNTTTVPINTTTSQINTTTTVIDTTTSGINTTTVAANITTVTVNTTTVPVNTTSTIPVITTTTLVNTTSTTPVNRTTTIPINTTITMPVNRTTTIPMNSTTTTLSSKSTTPSSTTTSTTTTIVSMTTSTMTPISTTSTTTPSTTTTTLTTTTSATLPTTTLTTTTSATLPTTAQDMPPTANAGPDITITLPDNSLRLYGNGSTDDRGIVQYEWRQLTSKPVDMYNERTSVLYVSNLVEGIYQFELMVTDTGRHTSRDIVMVTVEPAPTTTTTSTTTTTTTTPTSTMPPFECQEVTFEPCRSRGFQYTLFPNLLGHEEMSEAAEAFTIEARGVMNQLCQEVALTYMCSLYFPKCVHGEGYVIYPCPNLCQEASTSCAAFFSNPFECFVFEQTEQECVELPATTTAPVTTPETFVCEPTVLQDCVNLGFTSTHFPNFWFEPNQTTAVDAFETYFRDSLGPNMCHPDLLFFLCSVQFPRCQDGMKFQPCRRTCNSIIKACPDFVYYFQCDTMPEIDCVAPPESPIDCLGNEFSCRETSRCIPNNQVCNGVNNCGDWTDEMNCTCNEYQFQCKMGMCIKLYQRCDGTPQCPDNSDEKDCVCSHGQVACPSGKCIQSEWLCDGRAECEDGWDEMNCNMNCSRNEFVCSDHSCIGFDRICDMYEDCPDGNDEWDCLKQDSGILQLRYKKTWLALCAENWLEEYGDYTCNLLGEGAYLGITETPHRAFTFYGIPQDGQGNFRSVLGEMALDSCPSKRAVTINCEPRGCGKRMLTKQSGFIVNGEAAPKGSWPWQAGLYYGGQYFCGGTLINENFVLTAAHCVEVYQSDFRLLTVKLGAHNREQTEVTQHVVAVEAIKSHRQHVYFEKNDIALLQLANPVKYTSYIQPVCLPGPNETLPLYSECYTVGWGKTKWDGPYAETLQQLKMTLWDTQKCNSSIAWNGEVYDTFLCAGYFSGVRSICKGDSGGPLLCLDNYRTWKIIGVSSYVANFCNMTERPNIFTNVKKFIPWIEDHLECKFRCDNNKCLYNSEQICDRVDNCGDNSDEVRLCNRTVDCDFEDKFLCGYTYDGWMLGYDNKLAQQTIKDGQVYTQSYAPQYDHTVGRYPGHFFYGKEKNFLNANLTTDKVNITTQTCLRFYYYLRGEIDMGFKAQVYEYYRSGAYTGPDTKFLSGKFQDAKDEWKMAFFDLTPGEYKISFVAGDLLKTAIDDVKTIPGICSDVVCDTSTEFRCRSVYGDKCIANQIRCDLAVECEDAYDEMNCPAPPTSYQCDFNNGNLCSLRQDVDDATDWWIVNASFVQGDRKKQGFLDHTTQTDSGYLFYLNTYILQTDGHVFMRQRFKLHNEQYCLSFYYQLETDAVFHIHLDCDGCTTETHVAMETFGDWTQYQMDLPVVDLLKVTYDVVGTTEMDSVYYSFIVLDDIQVRRGQCPQFVCPANFAKCRSQPRCVPKDRQCDRTVNCIDASDEEGCVCTADEFQCASGRCIPISQKCDKQVDCLDGSDEGDTCVPLNAVSCTFEHPYMCGYEFISHTAYTWSRHKGGTATPSTGPHSDHTLGTSFGYYVYTEANHGGKNDTATLVSPVFNTGSGRSLEFYFHIYSSQPDLTQPGVLRVSLDDNITLWESSLHMVDAWQRKCLDLPAGVTAKVNFTAERTETTIYGVDIAVDDVSLNNHLCSETTSSAPSTTTTTIATPAETTCAADEWRCRQGACIPLDYVCDTFSDCPDGEEEWDCP